MVGRNAMELEIANAFPDAEYRDTWVWFQSGINTDGAHNPVTSRRVQHGDILSLNSFPMISGYYTALERTMFLGDADPESLRIWKANVATHEYGISLLKPGVTCGTITRKINDFLEERGLLQYRTFGYGHSFGILSHYYGREAELELREDIERIGKHNFSRTILSLHKTAGKTNFEETRQLFVHGVLTEQLDDGTPKYYNSNILSRYFRKDYYGTGQN